MSRHGIFDPTDVTLRQRMRHNADFVHIVRTGDSAHASARMLADDFDGAGDLVKLLDYTAQLEAELSEIHEVFPTHFWTAEEIEEAKARRMKWASELFPEEQDDGTEAD